REHQALRLRPDSRIDYRKLGGRRIIQKTRERQPPRGADDSSRRTRRDHGPAASARIQENCHRCRGVDLPARPAQTGPHARRTRGVVLRSPPETETGHGTRFQRTAEALCSRRCRGRLHRTLQYRRRYPGQGSGCDHARRRANPARPRTRVPQRQVAKSCRQGLHGHRSKRKKFFHHRSREAIEMNTFALNSLSRSFFLCCLLISAPLVSANPAQRQSTLSKSAPVAANKFVAVKVTGTTRYTDKEILGAAGLQLGQNAADGDFKEASQRLGDSGMFSEVAYSFAASNAGVKLYLQLADTDKSKLVPASFDNFVWFTDAELLTLLQSRVPLFKQLLPLAGTLPNRVSEALQALLSEKHYPGRVDFLRVGDENGGPLHAINYHVEEVSIRIRSVEFPGASPEQTTLLTTAAHRLTGTIYVRTALAAAAKFDLLPVYLQRGYLKAAFGPSDARAVSQSVSEEGARPAPAADAQASLDLQVDAIVPVMPGKVYATSSVDWKGNAAITTAEVAPLIHL